MRAARANAPPVDATAQELTDIGETDTAATTGTNGEGPSTETDTAEHTGANGEGPSNSGTAAQEPPSIPSGQITVAQIRTLIAWERRHTPRDVTQFRLADQ